MFREVYGKNGRQPEAAYQPNECRTDGLGFMIPRSLSPKPQIQLLYKTNFDPELPIKATMQILM